MDNFGQKPIIAQKLKIDGWKKWFDLIRLYACIALTIDSKNSPSSVGGRWIAELVLVIALGSPVVVP